MPPAADAPPPRTSTDAAPSDTTTPGLSASTSASRSESVIDATGLDAGHTELPEPHAARAFPPNATDPGGTDLPGAPQARPAPAGAPLLRDLAGPERAEQHQIDSRLREITAANRASWNSIHGERPGRPAAFFAGGGSALGPEEVDAAGDVTGRRVLQLACSCGDEALSWANLGASVTGVDISEVAVELARTKSSEAGIPVDFRRADMLDLPADLTDLDLIYLSWGAICWVPDLTIWATMIADRLRPGGSILLADHHPIWEVLAVTGPNAVAVTTDYFGRTTPRSTIDNAKLPTGARDTPAPPPFTAFVWPPSDIITALLAADLHLTHFIESPIADMYDGLGPSATHLPATYLIRATRNVSRGTTPRVIK